MLDNQSLLMIASINVRRS